MDRSVAFLISGFLFACYLLTFVGSFQSSDGLAMFATTENMVRRGGLDASQILWMDLQQGTYGPDGNLYSRKGLGMSLLAWPLVWLAQQWQALGLVQTALLLNPILTAWTGGLLYRATVRLGWSHVVGVITALSFGLATLAWPYTQSFFSDPMSMWGLFGGLYGLLAFQQDRRKRYLFLAGVAWGLAYLSRSVNLLTLPIYALALFWILWPPDARAGQKRATDRVRGAGRSALAAVTAHPRQWILFGLPIGISGALSLWWNWARFGHPLESGYLPTESFSGDWLFGLYGLLIGPARGIVWYSPVILLAGWGVAWFWRRQRWLLWLIGGTSLLYWLLYAKWYMWHGGYSWGPRFLVPILPFVMLLTPPVWQAIFVEGRGGRAGRAAGAGLALLSLGVQWLGMLVPFSLVQDWLAQTVTPLFAAETFTQLPYSPLLLQWRYLTPEHYHFAWWRAGAGGPDWLSLGLLLMAGAGGAGLLLQRVRRGDDPEGLPVYWLYGVGLLLVTLVSLTRYQLPLSGLTVAETARQIESLERAGDGILHLRPLESGAFANVYHGRLPVYGLFPQNPLGEQEQILFNRLLDRYERLWIVPDGGLPEQSGWELPLRGSAFLLSEEGVGPGDQRVALYALANGHSLVETGVGVTFGEPAWARLNGYGVAPSVAAGGELLVSLSWESLAPVDRDYQIFVHLINSGGERVAQRDGQPVLWLRPTSAWQPGERITDRYGLLLDPALPAGSYRVLVGIYDPQSGERQPVSAGPGAGVILGPVEVR